MLIHSNRIHSLVLFSPILMGNRKFYLKFSTIGTSQIFCLLFSLTQGIPPGCEVKIILQPNSDTGKILIDSFEKDVAKQDFKVTIESVRLHIPICEMDPDQYTYVNKTNFKVANRCIIFYFFPF